MTYLEKIRKEREIEKRHEKWVENRKNFIHKISSFYSTKGINFAKDLEKLISKYEKLSDVKGIDMYYQVINSKNL